MCKKVRVAIRPQIINIELPEGKTVVDMLRGMANTIEHREYQFSGYPSRPCPHCGEEDCYTSINTGSAVSYPVMPDGETVIYSVPDVDDSSGYGSNYIICNSCGKKVEPMA